MAHSRPCCRYQLDHQLRVVAVDEAWIAFAQANQAPELADQRIIGLSVMSAIADRTTALLYQHIFEHVRVTQQAYTLVIQCDSADCRRKLELTISPISTGFDIQSTILALEPRESVAVLTKTEHHSQQFIHICSFCKQVLINEQEWLAIEEAIVRLQLMQSMLMPHVTHGVCPRCLQTIEQQLEQSP